MQTVYIVEDDENIREMVLYALHSAGFAAEGFAAGEPFWQRMAQGAPSLVLLDIMLPGENGIAILQKLRAASVTRKLPVIMLTAKSTELARIKGLDAGADDYISKPFSVLELISRIRAVLRRTEDTAAPQNLLQAGNITLDMARRQVLVNKREILLTYKEFELLRYLLQNEGLVLTREQLLSEVWGFDYNGESRTVDMHIKALRQKLGEAGNYIKTVRSVGYKLGGQA